MEGASCLQGWRDSTPLLRAHAQRSPSCIICSKRVAGHSFFCLTIATAAMSDHEEEEPEFTAQQQEWIRKLVATQVQAAVPTSASPGSAGSRASSASQSSSSLPGTSSGTTTGSTAAVGNTGESHSYRLYKVLPVQGLFVVCPHCWAR